MSLDMPREATDELSQLIQLSPAEPSVHVQMGKAYKKLGDFEKVRVTFAKSYRYIVL
jgi:Flp pilus assembly protein TadD